MISLESIFKDANHLRTEIEQSIELREKILGLLVLSVSCSGLYGLVMGFQHSLAQALSSAVKVPLLFMATLLICLPTLHFVGLLFGSQVRFLQSLAVLLWGIAVMSVLLSAFAPVALFFLFSQSRYEFILLLHVTIFAFCGLASLVIIRRNMNALSASTFQATINAFETANPATLQPAVSLYSIPRTARATPVANAKETAPAEASSKTIEAESANESIHEPAAIEKQAQQPATIDTPSHQQESLPQKSSSPFFLNIWICLYMFVGTQMAFILSPFVGQNKGFTLVHHGDGNFFLSVIRAIGNLLR